MKINDSAKRLKNEDPAYQKPPVQPNNVHIKDLFPGNINDLNTPMSCSKGSLIQTPNSRHRKANSWAQSSPRNRNFTPSKSRFDCAEFPINSLDVRACEAEVLRLKSQKLKELQLAKMVEKEEWYKINNERKKQEENAIIQHEGYLVNETLEYKKLAQEKEKERKLQEKKEREDRFMELRETKLKLKEMEKYTKKQRDIEEQKELKRKEKEDSRRLLLESINAKRNMKAQEELRLKKEREIEISQYALGLKGMISKQTYWVNSISN